MKTLERFLLSIVCAAAPLSLCAQEQKQADTLAIVDGFYRVKAKEGIFGIITKRLGTQVVFQPCVGEAQTLDETALEKTDNKCWDGTGGSVSIMNCDGTFLDRVTAYLKKKSGPVEIGALYEGEEGKIAVAKAEKISSYKPIVQIQNCDDSWAVGFDALGKSVVEFYALDSSKLTDSQNLQWQ